MSGINPTAVAFLQPAYVDLADASGCSGRDANTLRQMNGRLSDAAVDPHVVTALWIAAQVCIQLPGSEVEGDAAQVQTAQVEVRFACAHLDHQIHPDGVVESYVPL